MKRRTFLKQGAATIAGVALTQSTFAKSNKTLVGIQLYSIREDMKADPLGSLRKVASIGYKHVEHANYVDRKFYGYSTTEFKTILDDLGLKMPSGHTTLRESHYDLAKKDFTDAWKYTVEDAATLGQQFVISPSLEEGSRNSLDKLKAFLEIFNKAGELCKKSGMRFGYHNHHFEFTEKFGSQTLYDIILTETDPDLVVQQFDMGNLFEGGAVAMDVVRKYPNRFLSLHVKDEIKANGHYESTVLGKGIANVKEVLDLCQKSGSLHFIVEQEAYQGIAPMESIALDLRQMEAWGYR